jgi:hypothetical protein
MVENTVHRIEDHTPKLVVGIWATRDSVYSARFSSFGGRSIPSGQNPKMSILLGSRLTTTCGLSEKHYPQQVSMASKSNFS